jgi:hypothetical protein
MGGWGHDGGFGASRGIVPEVEASVRAILALVAVLLAGMAPPGVGLPGAPAAAAPNPGDILARVRLAAALIEQVRVETGRPPAAPLGFRAEEVQIRDAWYQACVLHDQVGRLVFELTGELDRPIAPVAVEQIDAQVLARTVDDSVERLRLLTRTLGLPAPPAPSPPEVTAGLDDVFLALVDASRQIDPLLRRPMTASDVYEELTLAVHGAARLLGEFPGSVRLPDPPPLEHGKRPADTLDVVMACHRRLVEIAAISGVDATRVAVLPPLPWVRSADVYAMAVLVVGQLAYFEARLPGNRAPAPAFYPGLLFPSRSWQRAGMLLRQLDELRDRVQQRPGWLRR